MTEGEFPFRSFTMRSEGYDRPEVDSYVDELQGEITELRRAIETAAQSGSGSDTRLHDPEGAVTRTLAIAQETADRVLHDAQVEADGRRAEADEHATSVIADADGRAARLLGEMEAQAAEVREQGVAAARSAIQVERDKAMAELAHVRRVRDDLRSEAVDLKGALDQYRSQAREASDTLAAVSTGPLMSLDLPDFIDDDVVLAGIAARTDAVVGDRVDPTTAPEYLGSEGEEDDDDDAEYDDTEYDDSDEHEADGSRSDDETTRLHSVDGPAEAKPLFAADDDAHDGWAEVISIDGDEEEEDDDDDDHDPDSGFGGTFLAEVRAAAEDDDVALAPENDESDRFLSELRGIAGNADDELDSDAAETFFDDE